MHIVMMPRNTILLLAIVLGPAAEAWIGTSPSLLSTTRQLSFRTQASSGPPPQPQNAFRDGCRLHESKNTGEEEPERKKGLLEMLSPYDSKIPPELRDEIYAAEANTPAAKERGQRVALYVLIAFVGVMSAFFNGFLTELRGNGVNGSGIDISEAGFAWVVNNPILSFLFLNKIGGGICLLGGGGSGLLAEAELDTKRINAEKIYEELERRRQAKTKKPGSGSSSSSSNKKKRRGGKESKRLVALSEVIAKDETPVPTTTSSSTAKAEEEKPETADLSPTSSVDEEPSSKESDGGIFGSLKSLYDKADTMAASQALIMNKKLEDAGVIEKITDESGLKIIGREEAARLKAEKEKKDEEP